MLKRVKTPPLPPPNAAKQLQELTVQIYRGGGVAIVNSVGAKEVFLQALSKLSGGACIRNMGAYNTLIGEFLHDVRPLA